MRISGLGRYALTSYVAAAMLVGCGGDSRSGVVPINVAPALFRIIKHFTILARNSHSKFRRA